MESEDLCFTFSDSNVSDLPYNPETSFADLVSLDLQSDQVEFTGFRQQYAQQMKQLDHAVMGLQNQLTHALVTNAGLLNELRKQKQEANSKLLSQQAHHERKLHRQQNTINMLSATIADRDLQLAHSNATILRLQKENSELKALQQTHTREIENYAVLLKRAKDDLATQLDTKEAQPTTEESKLTESPVKRGYSLSEAYQEGHKESFGSELQSLILKIK